MANYIQTMMGITRVIGNSPGTGSVPQEQETIVTTSNKVYTNYQDVGTSHEALAYGDITDDCVCVLKNTHATAVIEVGVVVSSTFYPLFKIPAGERSKLSRLSGLASTYVKSSVAGAELEVTLYKIA